jgi:branched-chain amino acid transport system substrate-binding protein
MGSFRWLGVHPMKWRAWLVAVLASSLMIASTSWAAPVSGEPVRVGVITSQTGRFATFGKMQVAGYKVALDEINGKGGVKKRPLELLMEDDASAVPGALSAAERLLSKNVPLILGTYSSGISKPLASYMDRQQQVLLVSGSSDDSITKPGSPWIFRAKSVSSTYARTLFDLFDYLKATYPGAPLNSMIIIGGTGAFEQAVGDAAEAFTKVRGYKLLERQSYDQGLTDFRPILNRFRGQNPDIIFMVSYEEDSVAIMRQAKEVNLNPRVFAGAAAGFAIESFTKGGGDAAEWVFSATSWQKDAKYAGAVNLYERLKAALGGGEPSYHAAESYMALIVTADALNRAPSFSREDVRDALKATDLTTPVGPVKFQDSAGFKNQNQIPMLVIQVQGGKFVTVFPQSAAAAKLRYPTPAWDKRQ